MMTRDASRAGLPELRVLPDASAVAATAGEAVARGLAAAVDARGVAHWATTGGSAAPGIYRVLRVPPLREAVDWDRVHVWWGDDRFVPGDHPLSNVLPLTQVLLDTGGDETVSGATSADVTAAGVGVHLPAANLHPVPASVAIGRGAGPAWAAEAYAGTIRSLVPATPDDPGLPVFDVVVLGVGPDGHVLSVFPGSAVWDDPGLCAAVPAPTHVAPHVARVTLHPRVLAAARHVLVVATGAAKSDVLVRAWGGGDVRDLPVRATMLPNATWVLDEAAAAGLPRR